MTPPATAAAPAEIAERAALTHATADRPPFKVRDLSLAEFGRKEIRLAEQEMPG
jgi:adenosylhomocysteinase